MNLDQHKLFETPFVSTPKLIPLSALSLGVAGDKPPPDLTRSLRDIGLLVPLVVKEVAIAHNGHMPHYRIVDGSRRFHAAWEIHDALVGQLDYEEVMSDLGLDPMRCVVVSGNYAPDNALTLVANHLRSGNNIRDFLALESELARNPELPPEELAQLIHVPRARLEKLASLRQLATLLRLGFIEGKVSAGAAFQLAKWPKDLQEKAWKVLDETGKLRHSDLREITSAGSAAVAASLPFDSVFGGPGVEAIADQGTGYNTVEELLAANPSPDDIVHPIPTDVFGKGPLAHIPPIPLPEVEHLITCKGCQDTVINQAYCVECHNKLWLKAAELEGRCQKVIAEITATPVSKVTKTTLMKWAQILEGSL